MENMATEAAILVHTADIYIQTGQVERVGEKKPPGIQTKVKWKREVSEVTIGSGEQGSE